MAAPIGPGDWVECAPHAGYRGEVSPSEVKCAGNYPVPGRIYQVREVGTYGGPPRPGLRLVGIVVSYGRHPDCWFEASCFRPIYRPKQEIIEALEAPVTRTPQPVKKSREEA